MVNLLAIYLLLSARVPLPVPSGMLTSFLLQCHFNLLQDQSAAAPSTGRDASGSSRQVLNNLVIL